MNGVCFSQPSFGMLYYLYKEYGNMCKSENSTTKLLSEYMHLRFIRKSWPVTQAVNVHRTAREAALKLVGLIECTDLRINNLKKDVHYV